MNLVTTQSSLKVLIEGDAIELDEVENILSWWSSQFNTEKSRGFPIYSRSRGFIRCLTGVILDLWKRGLLKCENPPAQLSQGESLLLIERSERLVSTGRLRRYQAEAACAALRAPLGRGIISAFMGAGKTRIAAAIISLSTSLLSAQRASWIYAVTNTELADQARCEFEEVIPELLTELEYAGKVDYHCCSYGTIPSSLQHMQGLIVDEVHGVGAQTRAMRLSQIQCSYRIGMSGTPLDRSDSRNGLVVGLIGPIVYTIGMKELIEKGYLAKGKYTLL